MKIAQQIAFSSILFDSLFGLILFFGLDSFAEIKGGLPFTFYLFSTIILVHWWLIFKSADDAFSEEVTDSAVDIVFGIIYVILVEYIILSSKVFNVVAATGYLVALLAVDLVWALAWRYVGEWNTKSKPRIKRMEKELGHNIYLNFFTILTFAALAVLSLVISAEIYVLLFIILYSLYIIFTFRTKIIDLRIF